MMSLVRPALALIASLALPALLAGCGTPAQSLNMSATQADVLQLRTWVPDALKNNVDLDRVKGGETTSPWWGSQVSGLTLERALDDTLRDLGMLPPSPQTPAAYQLQAQIVSLVQPVVAADTTVTLTVNYTLINRTSGAVLYQRAIRTAHKAAFTDAIVSMPERTRLANEGAVRASIVTAVRDLMALRFP